MKNIIKKFCFSLKAFVQTWKSDFPNMGQKAGSHVSLLPNGSPAISLAEAVRRGAWLYKDEPKVKGARVWNPDILKAV